MGMSKEIKVRSFTDTIRWYNENAKKYAKTTEEYPSPEQIEEFVSLLSPGNKILDAGCGGGRDTKLLHDKGLDSIGLDLSSGLIKVARKKYPNINFVEGSFLDLPFGNDSFDGIWAHASLLHLETVGDVKKALSEFQRVLKPNGVMHTLVKAQTGLEKTAIVSDRTSGHERFFQYFTQDEIATLLREAGFAEIKTEQYRETDRNPNGRPEVEWILTLSKKDSNSSK